MQPVEYPDLAPPYDLFPVEAVVFLDLLRRKQPHLFFAQ